jgi:transcriptional regulator with XRE-family HTH domain
MAKRNVALKPSRKPSRSAPEPRRGSDLKTGSLAPQPAASRSIAESIGNQVRNLRRKLDLTGAELADQAGLSAGMLSKIENGAVSASIESLEALARALNVSLTTFFASYEEQRDCSHVHGGQGVTIRTTQHQGRAPIPAARAFDLRRDRGRGPYLITLTEEAKPYTMFQHAGVEWIYLLTGKVLYRHADKAYPLLPGDALFFDAAALHGPEELTKLPMNYLSIIIYPRT